MGGKSSKQTQSVTLLNVKQFNQSTRGKTTPIINKSSKKEQIAENKNVNNKERDENVNYDYMSDDMNKKLLSGNKDDAKIANKNQYESQTDKNDVSKELYKNPIKENEDNNPAGVKDETNENKTNKNDIDAEDVNEKDVQQQADNQTELYDASSSPNETNQKLDENERNCNKENQCNEPEKEYENTDFHEEFRERNSYSSESLSAKDTALHWTNMIIENAIAEVKVSRSDENLSHSEEPEDEISIENHRKETLKQKNSKVTFAEKHTIIENNDDESFSSPEHSPEHSVGQLDFVSESNHNTTDQTENISDDSESGYAIADDIMKIAVEREGHSDTIDDNGNTYTNYEAIPSCEDFSVSSEKIIQPKYGGMEQKFSLDIYCLDLSNSIVKESISLVK